MAEPLRALFVNEGALGAGVLGHARVAGTLREQLHGAELDPRFAVLPPMSALTRAAVRQVPVLGHADLDLQATRWHLAQSLRARRAIRRELRHFPADVLQVHTHTLSFLAGDLMRRIPTLVSLDATVWDWHAMAIWRRPRAYSRAAVAPSLALERRALERAARVLAFTRWGREAAERASPRAHVIEHHPGVDLSAFKPGPRDPEARPRVLFVGGRFVEKGGHDLLAALGPLAGSQLELDIVTPSADVAAQPGVRVHRLGPEDPALTELFRRADVFCLPTYGDAVPLSVAEAMACGAPVVATDVGAMRDLLDDGRTGRLIPVGDVRALRAAVLALVRDPALRSALGAAARARAEERFDAAAQAQRLAELMRQVVAERSPGG